MKTRNWKHTLLLILSILSVIIGILTLVVGIYASQNTEELAAEMKSDTDTATIGFWVIISAGALVFLGGVFGILASRNPAKTMPFLVVTTIALILCGIAVYNSTDGGLIAMLSTGKGKLDPGLIIATVLTAVMDGLGHSIRSDYKKGK